MDDMEDINYGLEGIEQTDSETRKNRYAICQRCENLFENNRCKICNCWMVVKTRIPFFKCPEGKW